MKKILVCLLSIMMLFIVTSCKKETSYTVCYVDGAPTLSIINIMDMQEIDGVKLNFKCVSGVSELKASIINNESDIAVLPINLASILYNGGIDYKLLSVNIFGNLYLIGNSGNSFNDLKGKKVGYVGVGGTPEITLKYLLDKNLIEYTDSEEELNDKVGLIGYSDSQTLIRSMSLGLVDYGVLGEPAVTTANKKLHTNSIINLTTEWKKYNSEYTQAGIIVDSKLVDNDIEFVKKLANSLKENEEFLRQNTSKIKEIASKNGSTLSVDFDLDLINRCNVKYKSGIDAKNDVESYLQVLNEYNSKSIGSKLPGGDFYLSL